jgi:hypothetical protein
MYLDASTPTLYKERVRPASPPPPSPIVARRPPRPLHAASSSGLLSPGTTRSTQLRRQAVEDSLMRYRRVSERRVCGVWFFVFVADLNFCNCSDVSSLASVGDSGVASLADSEVSPALQSLTRSQMPSPGLGRRPPLLVPQVCAKKVCATRQASYGVDLFSKGREPRCWAVKQWRRFWRGGRASACPAGVDAAGGPVSIPVFVKQSNVL